MKYETISQVNRGDQEQIELVTLTTKLKSIHNLGCMRLLDDQSVMTNHCQIEHTIKLSWRLKRVNLNCVAIITKYEPSHIQNGSGCSQ